MSGYFQLLCESAPLATVVMALALFRVRRCRASATRQHLMVMAACAISVAAPLLITALPKWRVLPTLSSPVSAAATVSVSGMPSGIQPPASARDAIRSEESNPLWFRIAGGVWLAGASVFLTSIVLQQLMLGRMLGETRDAPGDILALAMRLRARRGIRRGVRIAVHDAPGSAFTFGVFRPCIVLPANHAETGLAELRIVLDHEMAHIQRLDSLHEWILQGFLAMWWFHPLAWLTFRHAGVVKERACDDLVLLCGEDPRRYAACLGEAMLRAHQEPALLATVSTFVRKAPHLVRLHAILDPSINRTRLSSGETLRACGPVTLAAVILSSLGFKAAAELQPHAPGVLAALSDADVPCLWTDAVEPVVRGVGIGLKQDSAVNREPAFRPRENFRAAGARPPVAARQGKLAAGFSVPSRASDGRRDGSIGENPPLDEDAIPEISAGTVQRGTSFVGSSAPPLVIGPVGKSAPIGAGDSKATPTSQVISGKAGSLELAAGLTASDGLQAYGYVAMEDAGVMLYSGIGAPEPVSKEIVEGNAQVAADHLADDAAVEVLVAGGGSNASGEPSSELFIPEDLGIRNVQASITSPDDDGRLTVSCEVPEETAAFWTAEATMDSQSWTSSEDIVSWYFSSGSEPGFIQMTAALREPVRSSRYTLLRLKGKW